VTDTTLAIAFTDGKLSQHHVCYKVLSDNGWTRSASGDSHWSRRSNPTLSISDIKRQVSQELKAALSQSDIQVMHYVLTIGNGADIIGGIQQLGDGAYAEFSNT